MGTLVGDRFLQLVRDEAERLRDKEGGEIDPIGKRIKWEYSSSFKDDCEYMYYLSSLDAALSIIDNAMDWLFKREFVDDHKWEWKWFKQVFRCSSMVAFNLRGYIGAFSEANMELENDKLNEIFDILENWFNVGMGKGEEWDKLYSFLSEYALEQVCDDNENKSEIVKLRVNREIKAFGKVLMIINDVMFYIFNDVYTKCFNSKSIEEQEEIIRIADALR